jgi:hypothetical protein
VAVLLRGDDRRAGALLLHGMLRRSSFAATTGMLGAPPSRRRPEWWGAPPSRQRSECWGAPPSRRAGRSSFPATSNERRCDDLKFDTNSKCPLCNPSQSQNQCCDLHNVVDTTVIAINSK